MERRQEKTNFPIKIFLLIFHSIIFTKITKSVTTLVIWCCFSPFFILKSVFSVIFLLFTDIPPSKRQPPIPTSSPLGRKGYECNYCGKILHNQSEY